jgi:hypothetical protein
MYTLLDDIKVAKKINDFITENPTSCRKEIYIACQVNKRRVFDLRNQGLIYLPPPMNRGRRWTMQKKYQEYMHLKTGQKINE